MGRGNKSVISGRVVTLAQSVFNRCCRETRETKMDDQSGGRPVCDRV